MQRNNNISRCWYEEKVRRLSREDCQQEVFRGYGQRKILDINENIFVISKQVVVIFLILFYKMVKMNTKMKFISENLCSKTSIQIFFTG